MAGPSPRMRTVELISRLDPVGIEYLRNLLTEILSNSNRSAALDSAIALVNTKPVNPG